VPAFIVNKSKLLKSTSGHKKTESGMIKLDWVEGNRYAFPIENDVLPGNEGHYHMEQIGEHDERQDVTKCHHHLDGTCDIYAIVEAGAQYLVHTPEKVELLRIAAGGEVVVLQVCYRKPS
jgi:hypothetical protein